MYKWSAGDEITADRLNLGKSFGGDGSDGALSISSGTTTLDLGGAAVVVKNYTSISITGDGKLAFSNPGDNGTIIILKSQGDVVITSSTVPCIDAAGMGAAGGSGGNNTHGSGGGGFCAVYYNKLIANSGSIIATGGSHQASEGGSSNVGNNGNDGIIIANGYDNSTPPKGGSSGKGGGGSYTAGEYSDSNALTIGNRIRNQYSYRNLFVFTGAGGASAGGGRGGGALIIECNGSLNFTTENGISVRGITATRTVTDVGAGGNGIGFVEQNVSFN